MYDDMALQYFRSMPKVDRKRLIKKIFEALSDEEKLDIAKLLAK